MKKALLGLFFLALVLPLFADDAIVLPQGVFRFRVVPSYSMFTKGYDDSGKSIDTAPTGSVTALSSAFELGIIDPITLGLQWAPGYYVASNLKDFPAETLPLDKGEKTGPDDLQIGAKIEVFGTKGFIPNDALRLAFTVGPVIPLDSYDADKEAQNYVAGKAFRISSSSAHQSIGFGLKTDADYKINEMFFLNLHGEAFYYMPNDSVAFSTAAYHEGMIAALTPYYGAAAASAMADVAAPLIKTKTVYGIEPMFEFEPHATFDLGGGSSINAGLPFTYSMTMKGTSTTAGVDTDIDATSLLTVGPNVSLFTKIGPLPVETELQYVLPLMGKNATAISTFSLQVKIFGKIF